MAPCDPNGRETNEAPVLLLRPVSSAMLRVRPVPRARSARVAWRKPGRPGR